MLLAEFGERGVGSAFFGSHISGVFSGSAAARTKGLIAQAQEWVKDERSAVSEWAIHTVHELEHMLANDERSEQEERFR